MGRRNHLVEGVSGAGKSAVCQELRRRGHATAPLERVVDEILRRSESAEPR